MATPANFRVDPRLASILGSGYKTSDHALKELVDNAWDAESEEVHIQLSDPLSGEPIVVADTGTGMTEAEVRSFYLSVATDRRTKRGARSPRLNRQIKGRKGIGKFAGIMLADRMTVETTAQGRMTRLVVQKDDLIRASEDRDDSDLEHIDLPLEVLEAPESRKGTIVTLDLFNQRLVLPTPDRLRQLLMMEYGASDHFRIFVNGKRLDLSDISGDMFERVESLPDAGPVVLRTKVTDGQKPLKNPGIVFRVGGKLVGTPSWFGLQEDKEIPTKLLNQVRVEIEADGLKDDVTADWGTVVESSIAVQAAIKMAHEEVKAKLSEVHSNLMQLAKARLKQEIDRGLKRLPEYRRDFAEKALYRILNDFYNDRPDRQQAVVNVVLDAFEKDEYWCVVEAINEARDRDVEDFAAALAQFGLLEITRVAQQAHQRLAFLDDFETLIRNKSTLEKEVHMALANNLWVFGPEYSLLASNRTTRAIVEEYLNDKYKGEKGANRPDLLLTTDVRSTYTLFEFKRPSHPVNRDDYSQGQNYRDELLVYLPNATIDLLIVGGTLDHKFSLNHMAPMTTVLTFTQVVSRARAHLQWLLDNLAK